eukprot:353115-Chlamydomonas_euryale.AAC.1
MSPSWTPATAAHERGGERETGFCRARGCSMGRRTSRAGKGGNALILAVRKARSKHLVAVKGVTHAGEGPPKGTWHGPNQTRTAQGREETA